MEIGKQLIIFGCGGHSRSVADVVLSICPDVKLIFVDDHARESEKRYDFNVLRQSPSGDLPRFIAIGDNEQRRNKYVEIGEKNLVQIISSSAYVSKRSEIGAGCFFGNFSHVGPEVKIGANTIINTAAVIEHEVKIGSHSHIAPNAVISGRTMIGNLVFIGAGASIGNYISICSEVIIGAGSTVIKDITEPGVYVGCPSKRIK